MLITTEKEFMKYFGKPKRNKTIEKIYKFVEKYNQYKFIMIDNKLKIIKKEAQ